MIRAAGAVVINGKDEVLVVHRPRYDDLSLPKGKAETGETPEVTAVREVQEETGVTIALQASLSPVQYQIGHQDKVIRWWRAAPTSVAPHAADHEVDAVAWLSLADAATSLTHETDRRTLAEAVAAGAGPALVIVRHAKAVPRKKWKKKNDLARPLTRRGRAQAKALIPILAAFGATTVVTSPAARARDTVEPFAKRFGLELREIDHLSEEGAQGQTQAVQDLVRELINTARDTKSPTVICSHRPVLPAIFAAAGIDRTRLPKGAFEARHLA